jgi:hypothetical protein
MKTCLAVAIGLALGIAVTLSSQEKPILNALTPVKSIVFEATDRTTILTIDLEKKTVTWTGSKDAAALAFWQFVQQYFTEHCTCQ